MSEQSRGALRPVQSGRGVLVHTAADRRLAASHWLLSASSDPGRTRQEWDLQGLALLPMGTLFSAVRMPEQLVTAVAGEELPATDVDMLVREAFDGPVICDPRHRHFYALVPASMPTSYQAAAEDWRGLGVELLGRRHHLGIPRLDLTDRDPACSRSYWAAPMASAAELCSPLAVARFIAAAACKEREQAS